jgi:hypothetical protein
MGYLAVNGWFIRWWLGENYAVPLGWQLAFALNLATTTGGSLAVQVAGRCGANGLRRAGQLIGLTGVLNLGLAVWAMKLGSVVGVASAAVVAQSFLNVALGVYVCRYLDLAVMRWLTRSLGLPLLAVSLAAGLKLGWPGNSWTEMGGLLAGYALLWLALAWVTGINWEFFRAEWATVRASFKR